MPTPPTIPAFKSATAIAAIDFETASREHDSAVAIGVVLCSGPHPRRAFYSLVRPRRSSKQFCSIHNISVREQESAPRFGSVWPEIASALGARPILLAHNAVFDRRILRGMLAASGIQGPRARFYCTLGLSRGLWPGLPCDLRSVTNRLGIPMPKAHHALTDAVAVADLALALQLGEAPLKVQPTLGRIALDLDSSPSFAECTRKR